MTAPVREVNSPLAAVWPRTRHALTPLGVRDLPLPDDLASALGGGRLRLDAGRWQVGDNAECRIVRIEGASSTIVNTLIFPTHSERLPVFVAELLVTGGVPRLAFLDLQAVGLTADRVGQLASHTAALADLFAFLPSAEAPAWATKYSTGGYVFTRTNDPNHADALADLYAAYLDLWVECAAEVSDGDDAPTACLDDFKREHLRHWPGTDYLNKLFGTAWTARFLHEFLYR